MLARRAKVNVFGQDIIFLTLFWKAINIVDDGHNLVAAGQGKGLNGPNSLRLAGIQRGRDAKSNVPVVNKESYADQIAGPGLANVFYQGGQSHLVHFISLKNNISDHDVTQGRERFGLDAKAGLEGIVGFRNFRVAIDVIYHGGQGVVARSSLPIRNRFDHPAGSHLERF